MQGQNSLTNDQIGQIYERILKGDSSSLYQLQQINLKHHIPKFIAQTNQKNIEDYHHHEEQPIVEPKSLKEELKIKRSIESENGENNRLKNRNTKYLQRKYIKNNQISKEFKQSTTQNNISNDIVPNHLISFPKSKTRNSAHQNSQSSYKTGLLRAQLKEKYRSNIFQQFPKLTDQKAKKYQLPNNQKINEFRRQQKAQLIANLSQTGSKKIKHKQKVDFKSLIAKSKQKKMYFEKLNEQEAEKQNQIIQYHRTTKQFIEQMKQKYQLNFSDKQKYFKRSKSQDKTLIPPQLKKNLPAQAPQKPSFIEKTIGHEVKKVKECELSILKINQLYQNNKKLFKKIDKNLKNSEYLQYIQNRLNADTISQQSQQQQIVQGLKALQNKNKYSIIMAETRDKKWGLLKRTNYELERSTSLSESKMLLKQSKIVKYQYKNVQSPENDELSKIVVNERLKDLLFS